MMKRQIAFFAEAYLKFLCHERRIGAQELQTEKATPV
jgi:hypothetical protein